MALARHTAEEMTALATEQFREYGFEGTTLARLAEAMGVEKAGLYYRFPGGKDEIALAVAAHVSGWFEASVFAPLRTGGAPEARLRLVAARLREFYRDGTKSCILEALSLRGGPETLAAGLRGALQAWLDAFTQLARESGHAGGAAKLQAEIAVARIEGALVLSRVLNDKRPFLRAVAFLPTCLLAPDLTSAR